MELWDAYDENMNKIGGVTLVRGEPIPDGCFHLVADVLVQHADGSYLLMQRDLRKTRGGLWEASAGGSALQGENPQECAVRELFEESGIRPQEMTELGRVLHRRNRTLYVEYLCRTDAPKDSIVLQDGETVAYKWVSGGELHRTDNLASYRILNFIAELT